MELPYAEEIYDFDTFTLEDVVLKIKEQMQKTNDEKWIRKANKILDIAELELKERVAVE